MSQVLVEMSTDFLRQGLGVRFRATGGSMQPTIRHGELITVIPLPVADIQMGDILLYQTHRKIVAHRLVELGSNGTFILRGDALSVCDKPIASYQILGKVIKTERNGRWVALSGQSARFHYTMRRHLVSLRSQAGQIKRSLFEKFGVNVMRHHLSKCFQLLAVLMIGLAMNSSVCGQGRPDLGTPGASATPTVTVNDYIIGPGDLVELNVVGQTQMSGKYRVSEAGTINLPYVGQITASGLTEARLANDVRESLRKYLRQPELSVAVIEFNSQMVTIIGAVKTPGRYPLRRAEHVLDALGMAGGLSDRAGSTVHLVRYTSPTQPKTQPVNNSVGTEDVQVTSINLKELLGGHPELNRRLTAGDVLNIPDADTIYVTGNVNKPGAYPIKTPVTLSQAIALAGGMTAEARRSQISLFRPQPGTGERVEVVYSLAELEKRKVKDPILMPDDVIYIRGSESRSLGLAFIRALTGGVGNSLGLLVLR